MISDTLSEAATEIRLYLADDILSRAYVEPLRSRIERLADEMDAIRVELDTPHFADGPRFVE